MKPLVYQTIPQMLARTANLFPHRPAIIFHGKRWDYQELERITQQLAAGLLSHGLQKGSHVAILSENTPNAVFSLFALEQIGAVACMPNTSLKAGELKELFSIYDVDFLMIGSHYKNNDFYEESIEIQKDYPLKAIFDISAEGSSPYPSFTELCQTGASCLSSAPFWDTGFLSPDDPGMILYTSGTTGSTAKAVLFTQYHMVNGGIQKAAGQAITEADVICCALQMFHIFCLDVNILAALATGACLAMPKDLHTASILETLTEDACTVFSCVPCMYQAIMDRPDFQERNQFQLRTGIIGGAFCPPEEFQAIETSYGFTLLPGLGQTEAAAGIALGGLSDPLGLRSTSVGHFAAHSEGKLIHLETGEPLPVGEIGEICIRTPLLMCGYYRQPDLTAQVIDKDGWLHTGDLGRLDTQGNLYYAGRIKEMINRGGEKIIPGEVEALIKQIHTIADCKIIGIPHPHYGEEVCACVIPVPGDAPDLASIQNYLKGRLADFKIPKYMAALDHFPMNATGKIKRSQLLTLALEQIGNICSRQYGCDPSSLIQENKPTT